MVALYSSDEVRRQLRDLSNKITPTLQPIFVSKKLEQDLKPKEIQPSIVNQQCVFLLCDAGCVGYTTTPTHQRTSAFLSLKVRQSANIFGSSR